MRTRLVGAIAALSLALSGCILIVAVPGDHYPFDYSDNIGASGYREAWTISADGTHRVRATASYSYTFQGEDSSTSRRVHVESIDGDPRAGFTGEHPSLAGDGSLVVYDREPDYDIFNEDPPPREILLGEVATGVEIRISEGSGGADPDGSSNNARISADGSTVVFESLASNLVSPPTVGQQVFSYDIASGVIGLVSMRPDGAAAATGSATPHVSDDGSVIAFASSAADLVAGDTNGTLDVFITTNAGPIERAVVGVGGAEPNADVRLSGLSGDGTTLAIHSEATNLIAADPPGIDTFLVDGAGTVEPYGYTAAGQAADSPWFAGMSADGSLVLYAEFDQNLVLDSGVSTWSWALANGFLYDRVSGDVLTISGPGSPNHYASAAPSITADGRLVLVSDITIEGFPFNPQLNVAHHVQAAQDLRIDSVTPSALTAGETTTVVVTGAGFYAGMEGVLLPYSFYDPNEITNVVVSSRTELSLDITIPANAPAGPAGLGLSTVGPTPFGPLFLAAGSCDCLTITAAPPG